MESYDPTDTRIHDPELAHDLAYVTDHYLPFLRKAQKQYFRALIEKKDSRAKDLSFHIRNLQDNITYEKEIIMTSELNRLYLE